ncbi:hypothetical protein [Chryseobacterium nematophagum]|uniref:hypothetical protein n=1 Tax=Chryseobacterium nematophagum TaxID=2305228 RepID=UPI00160557C6|nr:hypothetical protein [Chryseobacterium nematophagum]
MLRKIHMAILKIKEIVNILGVEEGTREGVLKLSLAIGWNAVNSKFWIKELMELEQREI